MTDNYHDDDSLTCRFDVEAGVLEVLMPKWATGLAHGKYVLGAQLPTRDGRRVGNAHIVAITDTEWQAQSFIIHHALTDAGTEMKLTLSELEELFHPPTWVSDVADVLNKFKRP